MFHFFLSSPRKRHETSNFNVFRDIEMERWREIDLLSKCLFRVINNSVLVYNN